MKIWNYRKIIKWRKEKIELNVKNQRNGHHAKQRAYNQIITLCKYMINDEWRIVYLHMHNFSMVRKQKYVKRDSICMSVCEYWWEILMSSWLSLRSVFFASFIHSLLIFYLFFLSLYLFISVLPSRCCSMLIFFSLIYYFTSPTSHETVSELVNYVSIAWNSYYYGHSKSLEHLKLSIAKCFKNKKQMERERESGEQKTQRNKNMHSNERFMC